MGTIDSRADERQELEQAMTNIVDTLRRMPAHWTDRRAALHAQINRYLDQHEALRLEDMLTRSNNG